MIKRIRLTAIGSIVPILLLLLWEVAVYCKWLPPSLSAAPSAIIGRCTHLLLDGSLFNHLLRSLLRISIAVVLGSVIGITSGILLGQIRWAHRLFSPFIGLLAPVPVVVWLPFVIMAFGSDELYKIGLAVIASFLIVHIHTFRGVQTVPRQYIELSHIYEKNVFERLWHIYLPASAPNVFTGLRLALAIAWIVIFFVEFGSSQEGTEGLGWFINDSRQMGRVEDEYAGVLLLAIVGYLTDLLVVIVQDYVLVWSDFLEPGVDLQEKRGLWKTLLYKLTQ
jgi:sulfonate transport system permease protein